jgi:hypothetical protein
MYALTGLGPDSVLLILRHGASMKELAVNELPGAPDDIFTIADSTSSSGMICTAKNDKYVVVGFEDATLVHWCNNGSGRP